MLYQQLLMGVHYQLDVFQQVIWLLVGSHTLFMRTRDPFFFSNNPCVHFWLQFQLTVNISAVTTALVGSFAYAKSPLAAIQLLWVNLLMDALASLALASEPPTDELLKRDPINRSRSIITNRMWGNMLGQASYQIIVIMVLLFAGPEIFGFEPGHEVEKNLGENSTHYTFIFNAFVWMQLFNEINSRSLQGEHNVFQGIEKNPLFCGILVTTAVLQVKMIEMKMICPLTFHVRSTST